MITKRSDGDNRTSMWMIYIAVAVDLNSEGLMIGAGSAIATSLALILALGRCGRTRRRLATIANFLHGAVTRVIACPMI